MTLEPHTLHLHEGGLDAPDVIALLREHLAGMHALSPPGSVHAFALERLRTPDGRFWTARNGDAELLGCAALQRLDAHHAGFTWVSLEPGTAPAFAPCGPFAAYAADPYSRFMTRELAAVPA